MEQIQNLDYTRGTTNTGAALRFAIDNLFNSNNGDRDGILDVAVVLTDGGSNEKVFISTC